MSDLSDRAESAVASLLESDEDQLYETLGVRCRAMQLEPGVAGSFEPDAKFDGDAMGPLDGVRELGRRIFRRWEREAYGLVCGKEHDDEADRQKILSAFEIGGTAIAAYIAAALVTSFGLAPAIAAVVAAILIKRFLRPTGEEFCAVWKESLD